MHIGKMKVRTWLGALSLVLMAGAQAQDPGTAMEGKYMEGRYTLVSSTPTPDGMWKFTKAQIEVSRLDQRHVLIAMACEWADEPTAVCDDWWTAQVRAGSLYLQDRNTDLISMRFDPSARTIAMTTQGLDPVGTVRTDVFKLDPAPANDQALVRRMKRAHWSLKGSWNRADSKNWTYARAKIAFGSR